MQSATRSLTTPGDNEPTVYDLRRSISTAYYAVFHYLAELCATEIVGRRVKKLRPKGAWRVYYRSLRHSRIRAFCMRNDHNQFSHGIQNFAKWFPVLQDAREFCDYENDSMPNILDAKFIIKIAKTCIESLESINESEREDFVAWLVLDHKGGVAQVRNRKAKNNLDFLDQFIRK